MKNNKYIWVATHLILSVSFMFTLYAFLNSPSRIPIHFNLNGEADGFAGKINYIFIYLVQLGICGLMYLFYQYGMKISKVNLIEISKYFALILALFFFFCILYIFYFDKLNKLFMPVLILLLLLLQGIPLWVHYKKPT